MSLLGRLHRSVGLSRRMLSVKVLPALEDNFMYLVTDSATGDTAVVDPVKPDVVLAAASAAGVRLGAVLTTHHHWDHAGGNEELLAKAPGLPVYGADDRIGGLSHKVSHGDKVKIGGLDVECLFTPCHTKGHICYRVRDSTGEEAVFTGDTLFVGGCGRFFEGSAAEMHRALVEVLASLPDATKVYCGHEYTVTNYKFAKTVEPSNGDVAGRLAWASGERAAGRHTVPSTIGEEKRTNPFMRVHHPDVLAHCATDDPLKAMDALRERKNAFKP